MMKRVIVLMADGRISSEAIPDEADAFKWVKGRVFDGIDTSKGWFNLLEPVRLDDRGTNMWGDEEAKLRDGRTVNIPASCVYRVLYGGDYMAGNVVIAGTDEEGNIAGLSPMQEEALMFLIGSSLDLYRRGGIGRIEATGPNVTIREVTREELSRIFGKGV